MQDFLPRKGRLPDEGEIWKLCEQINASYEKERDLLQKALPEEHLEFIGQQGRHRLASYALVPTLENQSQGKHCQEEPHSLEFVHTPKNWWPYKSLLGFKNTKNNIQTSTIPLKDSNEVEENKNLQNLNKKSMLLPHLQVGVHGNIIFNSLLKNENKMHSGKRNKNMNEEKIIISMPKEDKLITRSGGNDATNVQSTSSFVQRDSKLLHKVEIDSTLEKVSPQIATTSSEILHNEKKNDNDGILNEIDKQVVNKASTLSVLEIPKIDPQTSQEQEIIHVNQK